MPREVLIIPTGTANTASVIAGLNRVGANPVLANDPDRIAVADRVVLPGVGALAAALEQLEREAMDAAIIARVAAGRPTLAICLGLQLLCSRSEESPGAAGLGIMDTEVLRFPDTVTVPQMGWNRVAPGKGCRYLKTGHAYFANSYRATVAPAPWQVAWSDHGGPFVAAAEQGDILACQFHPELSGAWGTDLLTRWVDGRPEGGRSC